MNWWHSRWSGYGPGGPGFGPGGPGGYGGPPGFGYGGPPGFGGGGPGFGPGGPGGYGGPPGCGPGMMRFGPGGPPFARRHRGEGPPFSGPPPWRMGQRFEEIRKGIASDLAQELGKEPEEVERALKAVFEKRHQQAGEDESSCGGPPESI